MKNGFLKVAVTTPDLRVADCEYNKNQMVEKGEWQVLGVCLIY